jgi:hypothetical protein
MHGGVVFVLLFLANLVNTLYALAQRRWKFHFLDEYLIPINTENAPVEETETLTTELLQLEAL